MPSASSPATSASNGIDMLLMGAYGHSPLRSLLFGSKTDDLLRSAKVPTLLLRLRVERIEADAVHRLSEPLLASLHGGELLVRRQGDALVPERALYRVRLRVQGLPAALREHPQELRGRVVIDAARQALLTRYWQQASAVFVREAGL
jgi:hypothetical protein